MPAIARSVIPTHFLAAILGVVGVFLLAAPPVSAQFKQEPIDRKFEKKGTSVKKYVKTPNGDAEDKQLYTDYFRRYFFPAMKQSGAADLGKVGELRFSLFKDYIWPAEPAVQRELTAMAFGYAMQVLGDTSQYHPTVGYNAVLVLGGLDLEYAIDGRTNRRPSRPLPRANAELCKILTESIEQKRPLSLQAGALVGLERHARNFRRLPGQARSATYQTLIAVAEQSDYPEGVDDEVRAWIKRLACQALSNIGVPGPQGVIANAIATVATDESLPLDTRCEIAGMLAEINFEGAKGVDFKALYAKLKLVAAAVADEDLEVVDEYKELQVGRNGGRAALDQLLNHKRYFLNEDSEVKLRRRYFATRLRALDGAFRSVKPVAADQADEVSSFESAFADAYTAMLDKDQLDLEVIDELKRVADRVSQMTAAAEVAAAE